MKNRKLVAVIAITMLIALVFASCGGSGGKALAREAISVMEQLQKAYENQDEAKFMEAFSKFESIGEKYEQLSEKEQEIFEEEVESLAKKKGLDDWF